MLSASTLQMLVAGVTVGVIYALVALAFVVTYKATEVLNFALGEFFMLSAFLAVTLKKTVGLNFVLTIVCVCATMAAIGLMINYGIMRRMVGASFFSIILVTLGLGIVVRAIVLIAFGPDERGSINSLPSRVLEWGNLRLPVAYLVIMAVAAGMVVLVWLLFNKTRTGLHMRAVAENLDAATAMGVSVNGTSAVAWAVSLTLIGVAGSLFSAYTASVDGGITNIGLRALPAVLVGGIDSPVGAVLGGLIVGVVELLGAGHFGTEWRDTTSFGLLFLVIIFRPTGLLGSAQLRRT